MGIAEGLGRARMALNTAFARSALLALAVSVAVSGSARAESRLFDLAGFFADRSVSAGEVTTLFSAPEPFPEGERLQRWHLRFAGARIEGTVETEGRDGTLRAAVPVEGERDASGVELRYVGYAPGGRALPLSFRHRMVANADGTLQNHVTVRLLGLPLARSEVTFAKSERDLKRHLATAPHP